MIKKIAVIGTGVIGTGWNIRCLAHNFKVVAYDKDPKLKKKIIEEIRRASPFVKKLFNKKKINLKNFQYVTSLEVALKDADFIQENATENYKIKTKLMNLIGKYAKNNVIISSSSSGLLPTKIYSKCKNPARTMIGHPFNPVYLCPGVEVVAAPYEEIDISEEIDETWFFNCIEHVIDPVLLLSELKKTLKKSNSVIRIKVPNDYSSFQKLLTENKFTENTSIIRAIAGKKVIHQSPEKRNSFPTLISVPREGVVGGIP